MNDFVNPKKRCISLPGGCKDLVDVLKHPKSKHLDAVRRFVCLVLLQAQQDQATELIIGVAPKNGGTPIRYKIQDAWYDMAPFPSHIRPDVIFELVRMSEFNTGYIPNEGLLDEKWGNFRLKWIVTMTSHDGECTLVRVKD
jgi:hypothetical protein